jgi:hypothetical protein
VNLAEVAFAGIVTVEEPKVPLPVELSVTLVFDATALGIETVPDVPAPAVNEPEAMLRLRLGWAGAVPYFSAHPALALLHSCWM